MTLVVREADARECRAAGFEPEEALRLSIARSDEVYEARAERNGELLGIWGWRVIGFLTQRVDMWLLTSDAVSDHAMYFGRESKRIMDELLLRFSVLQCEVHLGHRSSLRWLRWLGFSEVAQRKVGDEVFLLMQKGRD